MIIIRIVFVLSLILGAASAMAQTAAPSPAATAAPTTTPCVKPGHYPGVKASDTRKAAWQNEMKVWGECVKVYVADLRAQIDAKIKTANGAIEDYNSGLKELQAEQVAAETGDAPAANTKPK